MLAEFIDQICQELEIPPPKPNEEKVFTFSLNKEIQVFLKDLDPGVSMQANICPCPPGKREDLFIYLMRANLLGQGTGGSRIGLGGDEKFLTLSLGLPYEMNYQTFKENLEDFVNYLIYWQSEVAKFEKEKAVL